MSDSLMVVIVGITVVFVLLVVLILFLYLMGAILRKNKDENSKTENTTQQKAVPVSLEPIVQEGISEEIVAAISAAIHIITDGRPIMIKKIRKAKNSPNGRSAWGLAGSVDNTTPF